nr:hypothetical protein [Flavobacterium soli]
MFESDTTLRIGTASGTLLSIMPNIFSEDIARTVVLAAVGAMASFMVTLFLKWIFRSRDR